MENQSDPTLHGVDAAVQPELFFALVGPVGTDLEAVCESLRSELSAVGYSLSVVRLSALLHSLRPYEALRDLGDGGDRIEKHMDAGDEVRRRMKNGGALAALAVAEIVRLRGAKAAPRPAAFVFRSLKHPAEVDVLRRVYGPQLFVLSVYDEEERRRSRLRMRLEKKTPTTKDEDAARIMARDEAGGARELGQDVRGAFPLADYFLCGGDALDADVRRFVRLLFGDFSLSPTRDEYAMALARVTARRSADLSRQVGAAIMDERGEVLVTGCNEVPRPGGGVYWTGDEPDGRDVARGSDANAVMGKEVLREVFAALHGERYLSDRLQQMEPAALVDEIRTKGVLKRTRVTSLIEFGRVVHAEMNALSHAARRGIAVAGAKLYCSTFPCHGCARHLLAAGIAEVVYIEPYPKSLAEHLYPEAISHGAATRQNQLVFRPFTGVAPSRYFEWFRFGKRKDAEGYVLRFVASTARPRVTVDEVTHRTLEVRLCDNLGSSLRTLGW